MTKGMARSGFAALLLLPLLAPACAGDDVDGPGKSELVADFEAECAGLFSCGCEVDFADPTRCAEAFAADWSWIDGFAAEAGLVADLTCFKSTRPFATFGCETPLEYDEGRDPAACTSCQHAYGTRILGETCTRHVDRVSDCAQGLSCVGEPEATCIDPCARAGVDESCLYVECAAGLFCDAPARCVALGAEGEPCAGFDRRCEGGLFCDLTEDRCRAPAGLGEPCGILPCQEGLVCAADTSRCVEPRGVGESCSYLECAAGLFCESWVCTPSSGPGEPCDLRLPGACQAGLLCNADLQLCEILPDLGEPCSDNCVDGSWCDHEIGECVAFPGEGEPCHELRCGEGLECFVEPGICAPPLAAVCVAP